MSQAISWVLVCDCSRVSLRSCGATEFAMRLKRAALLFALAAAPALAHVSDSGMDYTRYKDLNGAPCCDHTDCRPADDFVDVRERGQVRLSIDGQWIDVPRALVIAEDAR